MDSETSSAVEPRYAGFWIRVGAAVIDTLVLGLLLSLVARVLGLPDVALDLPSSGDLQALLRAASGGDSGWQMKLLAAVIIIAFWLTKRGTPGKLILGLEVVDAKTLGTLGVGQSIGRYLGYFVSIIPLCLGLLWVGFDGRKQGWHDKLAGTLVIHKVKTS